MELTEQFSEVIALIEEARGRAYQRVNAELITLYWKVGEYISHKVQAAGWGNGTVDQLAAFIEERQPGLKGFTRRGLYRMKQFYETYYPLAEKVSPLVTQITWTNHLIILSQCRTNEERQFYLLLSTREHYSKRELERQIGARVFERTMIANTQLPPAVRRLPQDAVNVFRDTYLFDFLNLPERHTEEELQVGLVRHLRAFMLEVGRHFTFVQEQYRLQVGNEDFYVDLLLYHRALQCLVAVELKVTRFKPEHLGQLNFYLEALDRDHRLPHENPSIGILLCASKDSQVVEYALSRSLSPTLVADYTHQLLDKELLERKLAEFYDHLNSNPED